MTKVTYVLRNGELVVKAAPQSLVIEPLPVPPESPLIKFVMDDIERRIADAFGGRSIRRYPL